MEKWCVQLRQNSKKIFISFKPPKLGLAPEFPKYKRHKPGGLFTEYKRKRSQLACAGFKENTQPQLEPQKMDKLLQKKTSHLQLW